MFSDPKLEYGTSYFDPDNIPDLNFDDYFISDEKTENFLQSYIESSNASETIVQEITTEYNIHMAYIILSKLNMLFSRF